MAALWKTGISGPSFRMLLNLALRMRDTMYIHYEHLITCVRPSFVRGIRDLVGGHSNKDKKLSKVSLVSCLFDKVLLVLGVSSLSHL